MLSWLSVSVLDFVIFVNKDKRMDKCCMDANIGESCKLLAIIGLCICVVGADAKKLNSTTPITLLNYFTNDAYTSPRLLAISLLCRIILVPISVFTIKFTALNMIAGTDRLVSGIVYSY